MVPVLRFESISGNFSGGTFFSCADAHFYVLAASVVISFRNPGQQIVLRGVDHEQKLVSAMWLGICVSPS